MPSAPAAPSAVGVERQPTRRQAAVFALKTWGLRAIHAGRSLLRGKPRRFVPRDATAAENGGSVLAESRTPLYPNDSSAEFALQAGKAQNLRVAVARLNGIVVPGKAVFSFWRHIGRPTRRAGFVPGRELREGCIVPSVGGGLCQLSNALYDAALSAGFEIVERHAHSRRLPGSMAEVGRDATVFWNYVDLRFRTTLDYRIEIALTRTELVVRFHAAGAVPEPAAAKAHVVAASADGPAVESCETCGVTDCFRQPGRAHRATGGVTAWLVDACWPEFDRYARESHAEGDFLFLPLDGRWVRRQAYGWSTGGYARVRHAPWETLRRAWGSRHLAAQGAARQHALLGFDAALAVRYARRLPAEATHLVVSQNLLPSLWQSGILGGRSFDVLMTRLPLETLQATLDRAAARHPGSATLADFRADPALAHAETAALAEAARWITPHRAIARLAGTRAHLLPWQLPAPAAGTRAVESGPVLFPASTLGRKGAYELRGAARELGLCVRLGGPVLEGPDFWHGVATLPPVVGASSLTGISAVILPAWVEHQPRRLLLAAVSGIPVIASEPCGLEGMPGVTTIPAGDTAALLAAVTSVRVRPGVEAAP